MSAMIGIGEAATIWASTAASSSRGTARRTMSAPASATVLIWSIVAVTFEVSVFVIVCTATGAPPPIGTPPTMIWRSEATIRFYGGRAGASAVDARAHAIRIRRGPEQAQAADAEPDHK